MIFFALRFFWTCLARLLTKRLRFGNTRPTFSKSCSRCCKETLVFYKSKRFGQFILRPHLVSNGMPAANMCFIIYWENSSMRLRLITTMLLAWNTIASAEAVLTFWLFPHCFLQKWSRQLMGFAYVSGAEYAYNGSVYTLSLVLWFHTVNWRTVFP